MLLMQLSLIDATSCCFGRPDAAECVSMSALQALVEAAAAPPLGATSLRNEASVTAAERDAVAKEHEGLDLPEGYYFDGMTYLDPFGERLKVTDHSKGLKTTRD